MRLIHLATIAVLFISCVDPFPDDLINEDDNFYVEQQPVEELADANVANNPPDSSSAPPAVIPPEPNEPLQDVVNVPESNGPSTTVDLPVTKNIIDSQTLPDPNSPLFAENNPPSSGSCPNRYAGSRRPIESSDPPWKSFLDIIKSFGGQQGTTDRTGQQGNLDEGKEEPYPQNPPDNPSEPPPDTTPDVSPVPKKRARGRICDNGIHQLCCEEEGDYFLVWFPKKCKKCEYPRRVTSARYRNYASN